MYEFLLCHRSFTDTMMGNHVDCQVLAFLRRERRVNPASLGSREPEAYRAPCSHGGLERAQRTTAGHTVMHSYGVIVHSQTRFLRVVVCGVVLVVCVGVLWCCSCLVVCCVVRVVCLRVRPVSLVTDTMMGNHVDCQVLAFLCRERLPKLAARLNDFDISMQLLSARWFLCFWVRICILIMMLCSTKL